MNALALGDMAVIGEVPAKLVKAMAVVADALHPVFSRQPWIKSPDKSKESCVLCALTIRDFLRAIGYVNAQVRPVATVIAAWSDGKVVHSAGMGIPGTPKRDGFWSGHMVVWVPASRTLIDATLYPCQRPQWPALPPMLAVACNEFDREPPLQIEAVRDLPIIVSMMQPADDTHPAFGVWYLDNPKNIAWRKGPDARMREERATVVAALVERFGKWSPI